ncbi:MAG: LysM peptidoglycan-binding domain-containing protein [bacterium]
MRVLVSVISVVILIAMEGCVEKVGVTDELEREHPEMMRAREMEEAGDVRSARNLYESILDRDPTVARAHFALAYLLDKSGEDYIGAIYHYRRYLVLRPNTEKRAMIESHIQSDMLALVGIVQSEHQTLKIRAANLQSQTVQLRSALAAVRAKYGVPESLLLTSEPIDAPAVTTGTKSQARMVKVEKADTLKKMAAKYYGDQGLWREIYEVNKKKMKSPGDLRVGQIILVPEL